MVQQTALNAKIIERVNYVGRSARYLELKFGIGQDKIPKIVTYNKM